MLYLARLLGPEEFGIMGMIVLFINMGNALVDSGMSTSLLRMKSPTEDDYSTVFLTNITISVAAYIILFLIAPFISGFYNEPILVLVIRVYSLGFIINAFRSIHVTRLMKLLDFRKIAISNIPGVVISSIVAIYMADKGYGIFSLVGLYLTNQLVSSVIYNVTTKHKTQFKFVSSNWKFHFNFGYRIMLSSQINILFENIYNIWIGKIYTKTDLGYYERSVTFNSYPSQVVLEILNKVSLPLFASVKDDVLRVRTAYKKIILIGFFVMCFVMSLGVGLAEPLFRYVLGEQWLPAVPYFRILTLAYIFYPLHFLNINLLSLFDRSDLFLRLEVIKKIVALCTLPLGLFFGIEGLLWSIVLSGLIGLYINTFYTKDLIDYSFWQQIKDLTPVFILFFIVSLLVMYMQTLIFLPDPVLIVISGSVGILIAILASQVTKLAPYVEIKALIKNSLLK